MERLKAEVLTVIALVRPMSGRAQRDHSIPCIVVKSLSNCQIVCNQIERLFHVGEAQAWAGVIGLGYSSRSSLIMSSVMAGKKIRRYVETSSVVLTPDHAALLASCCS